MHKHQNRMYKRKYTTTGLLAAFLAILKSFTCSGFELSMKASSSSSSPMSNRFVTNKMCPFGMCEVKIWRLVGKMKKSNNRATLFQM
mmetsp:Transcript_36932/g.42969  ORF Transcript_36932/g.42969 Transcript_36932/m.42969 type:complete len:87 (+) Transcript_36932:71-331(+)